MLSFFKPKYEMTDVKLKVATLFFAQYVEVMKHGKDRTDRRFKRYLYAVCLGLGVPMGDSEDIEEAEIVEVLDNKPPKIMRRYQEQSGLSLPEKRKLLNFRQR